MTGDLGNVLEKIMIVTLDGKPDERLTKWVTESRGVPKESLVYVDCHQMPERPIPGTSEVFVDARPSNYFVDREGHYDRVPLTRVIWSRLTPGLVANIAQEPSFREDILW
ncbi:MAG: hypothetical protein ABIA93_06855 [Candidatus Woesearchaeota archaeon]